MSVPCALKATSRHRSCSPRSSRSLTEPGAASASSPRAVGGSASAYRDFDAELRFDVAGITAEESPLCHSGEVLQGNLKPNECPSFGTACTPRKPLGATMVSSEGACAAYYNYGRFVALESIH